MKDVAFCEDVVLRQTRDAHEARGLLRQELEAVDAQLAEGQRSIDSLTERLRARDVP